MTINTNNLQWIILNLFLILPLPSVTKLLELEDFGKELFFTLCYLEPANLQLVSPLPLATLLIFLRLSAEKDTAFEVSEHLGLIGQTFYDMRQEYKDILKKLEKTQYFTMSTSIKILIDGNQIENIQLTVGENINLWNNLSICFYSDDLVNIDTKMEFPPPNLPKVELMIHTEILFKNVFWYRLFPTTKGIFNTIDGNQIATAMINHIAEVEYGEIRQLSATAVKVPYSNLRTFLLLLVPDYQQDIQELEKNLQLFPLDSIQKYLAKDKLKLVVPKFKAEVLLSLKDAFETLDMSSMFERLCDTTPHIKVADIMYKSSFDIDELTAGAETHIPNDPDILKKIPELRVEYPFMFLILSNENDIFFMGKVVK